MVKRWAPLYPVGRKLGFLGAATTDTLAGLERSGVSLFSMVFGNAVGLVETRKGKLSRGDLAGQLRSGLRAGDILLEKTPLRLTDKLIPGYWGRAAVWVGSEQELRDLGIWDDPVVVPYQDQIRSGKQVVEALRSGVEISRLVYLAYGDIDWPTQKSLGRTTFTPDHVAERALTSRELDLVAFYHDGRQVTE